MTASGIAAWYGAFIASVVLVWDVVKWRKDGPRIKAEARAGWRTMGMDEFEGKDVTSVKATNIGSRATMLTSFGMYWFHAGVSVRNRAKAKAFIIQPSTFGPGQVPKKIEPGDVWHGLVTESESYKSMQNEGGKFFIALRFSHIAKEVLVPVQVTANKAMHATREDARA